MSHIFLITISGLVRTPQKTKIFLYEANSILTIRSVGTDLRNTNVHAVRDLYDFSIAEFVVGGKLSAGEVGCLISHQNVYDVICNEKIEWALVFEDDAEILIDAKNLVKMSQNWFESGYELVHLSPHLGGVVMNQNEFNCGRVFVPPLSAYAYWISLKGARKLRTKKNIIGGLADWPVQVAKLRIKSVYPPFAISGANNSLIEQFQDVNAPQRISLAYRPLVKVLTIYGLCILGKASLVYGLRTIVRFVFLFRIYRKAVGLFKNSQKDSNQTRYFF
jgi:GR25 family glycosyltransferase involved in LPS biosynthesis